MISLKLDVTKLEKHRFFKSDKGSIYCDLVLIERASEWSDGFCVQAVSKEDREKGEKGPIVGNWKKMKSNGPKPVDKDDMEGVPF